MQAASDARTFEEALRDAQRFHEAEVLRLEALVADSQRRAEAVLQEGRAAEERHEQRLRIVVRPDAKQHIGRVHAHP
jgi:hypothetical protein